MICINSNLLHYILKKNHSDNLFKRMTIVVNKVLYRRNKKAGTRQPKSIAIFDFSSPLTVDKQGSAFIDKHR